MADQEERGREAERPSQIPREGWMDILSRVRQQVGADNLSIVAGGVAFYGLLALFPALAALVAVYGLVFDPAAIQSQIEGLSGVLPQQVQGILERQLTDLAATSGTALRLSLIISVLIAIWSATKGTKAMMTALNIVYNEEEKRGFIKQNALAVGLTAGGVVLAILALVAVAILPGVLGMLGLGDTARRAISVMRWPVLAAVMILALAVLYRYGPSRSPPQWRWVTWGAVLATALWLVASGLFSFYVANFGNYNETYGSLGAVVVLLFWLFISAYVVLLGAELDAESEHQTRRDSTVPPERPMGERGAYVADHVGRSRHGRQ